MCVANLCDASILVMKSNDIHEIYNIENDRDILLINCKKKISNTIQLLNVFAGMTQGMGKVLECEIEQQQ